MKLGEGGLREQAEGKGVSYLRVTEHLLQLSHRPQPARPLPQVETPAGPSRQCAPAWEEALTGKRALCWLPGE